MNHIILQPTGSTGASNHYFDTIKNTIPLSRLKPFIKVEEYKDLSNIYPDGNCMIWGVTPGKNLINYTKWRRLKIGDTTLFYQNKNFYTSSVTTYKLHNKDLAKDLWGTDQNNETWKYIYFVDEVKTINIDVKTFNLTVGYKINNIVQGFNVLDLEKSKKVFDNLISNSNIFISPYTQKEYDDIIEQLNKLNQTDKKYTGLVREEQRALRSILFRNKRYSKCGICNRKFPVELLVTAHIKKRSKCSESERKDINVVMPMCKFGCDDLYENGYIYVENGIIKSNNIPKYSKSLVNYVKFLENKKTSWYKKKTEKYFKYHMNSNKK